jgi:chemotaxis protein MotB
MQRSRVTHDRWLVSYADFITLLFAFFVVMYAFAKADAKKQMDVSASIAAGFRSLSVFPGSTHPTKAASGTEYGAEKAGLANNVVMGEDVLSPAKIQEDLNHVRHELEQTLEKQIADHTVSIKMGRDGLVISLREAGFFNSGSATPKPDTLATLRQIAGLLSKTPYDLRIEGHTDNVPIHTAEFDSNWELSSARATHIARLFLDLKAIPPERLSAAGYAEYHPVGPNSTAEGRAENRRVDLVVLPRTRINLAVPGMLSTTGPWRKVTDGDQPAESQLK